MLSDFENLRILRLSKIKKKWLFSRWWSELLSVFIEMHYYFCIFVYVFMCGYYKNYKNFLINIQVFLYILLKKITSGFLQWAFRTQKYWHYSSLHNQKKKKKIAVQLYLFVLNPNWLTSLTTWKCSKEIRSHSTPSCRRTPFVA